MIVRKSVDVVRIYGARSRSQTPAVVVEHKNKLGNYSRFVRTLLNQITQWTFYVFSHHVQSQ